VATAVADKKVILPVRSKNFYVLKMRAGINTIICRIKAPATMNHTIG